MEKKLIVISVGNLFSSFFFHVDVVEQISLWVIIILHQLFLNQTINSYPITCWSSVFYFIQKKCIRSISFEPYYLIMPNCVLTSLSLSLTLLLNRKKILVISVGNLFSSFFFHVDVLEQISRWSYHHFTPVVFKPNYKLLSSYLLVFCFFISF